MKNVVVRNLWLSIRNIAHLLLLTALLGAPSGAGAPPSAAEAAPPQTTGTSSLPVTGLLNPDSILNTTAPCTPPVGLEGVDVAESFGTIDWARVAQTKTFAYAKAGQGVSFLDPTFLTNYAGIKRAGMQAGAYFYFEPAQDPTLQANHFVNQLVNAGFAPGDLVPMLDVEISGTQTSQVIVSNVQTAVAVIRSSLLVTPGIYTYASFWNGQVGGSTAFANDPLWIANFGASCPTLPTAWSNWAIWQYTDLGHVTGITGTVDLDRANGTSLPVYTGTLRIMLPLIMVSH